MTVKDNQCLSRARHGNIEEVGALGFPELIIGWGHQNDCVEFPSLKTMNGTDLEPFIAWGKGAFAKASLATSNIAIIRREDVVDGHALLFQRCHNFPSISLIWC